MSPRSFAPAVPEDSASSGTHRIRFPAPTPEARAAALAACTVDLSLMRARVQLKAGPHGAQHYANAFPGSVTYTGQPTGRIVNMTYSVFAPYGVRLDGGPRWDVSWFTREEFEVVA